MQAFIVILVAFVAWSWLGWWLLLIVAVPVLLLGVWISLDSSKGVSSVLQPAAQPMRSYSDPLKLRIEIQTRAPSSGLEFDRQAPTTMANRDSRGSRLAPALNVNSFAGQGPAVALVIAGEPLEKILSGRKTWEMRTQNTHKRGPIALVRKGSGVISAVADITECRGPLTYDLLLSSVHFHGISAERLTDPQVAKYKYAWILSNVRKLPAPIPYTHTRGAQSLVRLSVETMNAVVRALDRD